MPPAMCRCTIIRAVHAQSLSIVLMGELIGIDSPLAGAHQQRNLALAIATPVELRNSHGYNITPIDIRPDSGYVWPARWN